MTEQVPAGGEQGDCLLRAQRLVPVQVMLLKQRSEELQASRGQFYAGAWRGEHGADHLIPRLPKMEVKREKSSQMRFQ